MPISSSARQYQDRKAQSQHALFQAAERIAAVGGWQLDLRTRRLICSEELRSIFGWVAPGPFTLGALKEAICPEDRADFDRWRRAVEAAQPDSTDRRFHILRGGEIRPVVCRAAVTRIENGRARIVTGTIRDTSDDPVPVAGIDTDHLYKGIFEHAVWGVFQTTADGRYLTVNPALARIYGYASTDELLLGLTDIGRQLYVEMGRREEFIRQMRENGVVRHFESAIYRRDGSIIWISEGCREVHAQNGEFLYYEGTVEDVTDRVRAEQAAQAAREAAERSNQAKSLFLANMSHELRTPLNAVLGFSEMLSTELFGPLGDPTYRDFAQDIYESGKHLLEIINTILDISKVEAGKLTLDEQDFDLAALMRDCEKLVAESARTGEIELTVVPPPEPIWMRADPVRLKQVLLNLLSNAIKFTEPGNSVCLWAAPSDEGALAIVVEDTGIGMNEADLARAMEPFQQIDNSFSRRHQGTGLGLPLTKSLVELHAGTLAISSAPGVGTTATVYLPEWRAAPLTAIS